ncbi:MAG: radical SAM family heme chaperone HemW [Planctomycetota bacterium]
MRCGVYVHVPFCRTRCPYCSFVLIESDGSLHGAFVERVRREIARARDVWRFEPRTVYFGGGTPSLLSAQELGRILEAVGGRPEEVTVECNPEGLKLDGLREIGVNRITLGVQALDDGLLRFLGRGHDAEEARRAWREASRRFDNVCVDLIFGVPGQTLEGWRRTLEEVRSWRPAHVSLYGLTYEPGTPFGRIRERLPEETERTMYEEAMEMLSDYRHYEISNWALPGRESLHNQGYWEGRPYLGFGPGAHSYVAPERWWNLSNVREYLRREDPVAGRERLTAEQERIERLFLGLRQDTGVELAAVPEGLERFLERGQDGRVRLTRAGRAVADSVLARLL